MNSLDVGSGSCIWGMQNSGSLIKNQPNEKHIDTVGARVGEGGVKVSADWGGGFVRQSSLGVSLNGQLIC